MSPFSVALRTLRAQLELNQREFAERLGCRQAHLSALECGTKLPKDEGLVHKIVQLFNLDAEQQRSLRRAFGVSRRVDLPPRGAPAAAYDLCLRLSELLPTLSSSDVREISALLESVGKTGLAATKSPGSLVRHEAQETPM